MLDIGNFYPEINTPYCVYARGLLPPLRGPPSSRRKASVRFAFGYRDNVMRNGVRTFGERTAKKIPLRRDRLALLPSLTLVKSSTPLRSAQDDTLNTLLGIE